MNKDSIIEKWKVFEKLPFPEVREAEQEFELTSLDSNSAGCISCFFSGTLDQDCLGVLKQSATDIPKYFPNMSKETKEYFELLHEIVTDILKNKGYAIIT